MLDFIRGKNNKTKRCTAAMEPQQCNRVFEIKGKGWYFLAREGLYGPYLFQYQALLRLEVQMQLGRPREVLWSEEERAARRKSIAEKACR